MCYVSRSTVSNIPIFLPPSPRSPHLNSVAEMKKKEQQDEQHMNEIYHENRRMSEPLRKAQKDVENLTQTLVRYQKDKEDLRSTKARLLVVEDQYRNLKWQQEVVQQRFQAVDAEREELQERFTKSIYEAQQKSGFRNILLEKKLQGMQSMSEQQNAALNEVLARANLEPGALGQMKGRVTDIFEVKNGMARELAAELERITSSYKSLVDAVENKMREFGVPASELGFEPLRVV